MNRLEARKRVPWVSLCLLTLSFPHALAGELGEEASKQPPISSPVVDESGHNSTHRGKPDHELTGFVRPAQMAKLTLAPPNSSNRIELNHFQPLNLAEKSVFFLDNTIYAKSRPTNSTGDGLPLIETWGESIRLGYRKLIHNATGFIGINGGYDASLQQGYYYQQLGIGFEAVVPGFTAQATLTQGIGKSYYPQLGDALLSSFNMQATFPMGIESLSMGTRFYFVHDKFGQSAPGGQLQFIYGFNRHLSANVSASYDDISGSGYSLQFKYLFNPPQPKQIPQGLSYGVASAFSQAIGNTGSRIIRLTGSVPAYGD